MSRPSPRLQHAVTLVVVLVFIAAPPADACAQPSDPSDAQRHLVLGLMMEGYATFQAGHYQRALRHFEAAETMMVMPTTRLWVGRAQEQLGQLVAARDTLKSIATIPKEADPPAPFVQARQEARERLRDIERRIAIVEVKWSVPPKVSGAQLTLDGRSVSVGLAGAPLQFELSPGKHDFTASAHGRVVAQQVHLDDGERRTLTIQLEPPAPPRPIVASSSPLSPVAWAGFSVGAAGLIAGAATGIMAAVRSDSLNKRCQGLDPCPISLQDDNFQRDYYTTPILAHVSTASFVVGGCGTALGLLGVFAFRDDDAADDSADDRAVGGVRMTPVLGWGMVGVAGSY